MLEITYTIDGKKSWMYFTGTEAKAKAHFNKQVKECGYKKTKLLTITPLVKTTNEKATVIVVAAPTRTSKRKSTGSRSSPATTPTTPNKRSRRASGNSNRRSTKQ